MFLGVLYMFPGEPGNVGGEKGMEIFYDVYRD